LGEDLLAERIERGVDLRREGAALLGDLAARGRVHRIGHALPPVLDRAGRARTMSHGAPRRIASPERDKSGCVRGMRHPRGKPMIYAIAFELTAPERNEAHIDEWIAQSFEYRAQLLPRLWVVNGPMAGEQIRTALA